MGLEYEIVESTRKELIGATCDRCNKKISTYGPGHWNEYGRPHSVYHESFLTEPVFILNHCWGYGSKKVGETHEAVLCESCYDIIFKDVKIHKEDL